MELWIRSSAKTNLLKARFLTAMDGKTFYKKNEWEYEGYTICNVGDNGGYELLGTYKTKERALEVLDEIQNKINLINLGHDFGSPMIDLKNPTYIYEMPKE